MKIKNDYFKHTTRTLLSEEQKRETIEAIERGCRYLRSMMNQYKFEEITLQNGYRNLYISRKKMIYLGRWGELIKGYTQPKYLYRRRRRADIIFCSLEIARDTGADFEEVKERFFALMPEYVQLNSP